ncbi:hypothetical protein ACTXT7_010357 [Hymenolepis weldensis]
MRRHSRGPFKYPPFPVLHVSLLSPNHYLLLTSRSYPSRLSAFPLPIVLRKRAQKQENRNIHGTSTLLTCFDARELHPRNYLFKPATIAIS